MKTYTLRLFGFPILQLDVVYWDEPVPTYEDLPPKVDVASETPAAERIVFGPQD